jgi:hypothetical protein
VSAANGIAVDGEIAGSNVVLDRRLDAVIHVFPLLFPGRHPLVIARSASSVVDDVRIEERQGLLTPTCTEQLDNAPVNLSRTGDRRSSIRQF